eukprot:1155917-Pelagomonas_calceolata.AAC.1
MQLNLQRLSQGPRTTLKGVASPALPAVPNHVHKISGKRVHERAMNVHVRVAAPTVSNTETAIALPAKPQAATGEYVKCVFLTRT